MLDKLNELREELSLQIAICEEIQGRWNGKESNELEDLAGLYAGVQDRLENSYKELLEAIVILHNEE